jgi:CBS-domain-containing membrane protein
MERTELMTLLSPLRQMTADGLMGNDVVYFHRETKCDLLLLSMVNGGFSSLPIVDGEKRLIGVVTRHNFLNAILSDQDLPSLEAGKIMSLARFVSTDCLAAKIGPIFLETGLSEIPVVDCQSRLVGMITEREFLDRQAEETFPAISRCSRQISFNKDFTAGSSSRNARLIK